MKQEVKQRRSAEMRYRMGTGGGPPLRVVEDPLTTQVETIVPHLDVVVDTSFDTDYHHRVATSQPQPCTSSPAFHQPFPSYSPPSPSHTFYLTLPVTPPVPTRERPYLQDPLSSPSLHAPAATSTPSPQAHAASSPSAAVPPSSGGSQSRKATKRNILEEELKARLAAIEEGRKQRRELHEMMMEDLIIRRAHEAEAHKMLLHYHAEMLRLLGLRQVAESQQHQQS